MGRGAGAGRGVRLVLIAYPEELEHLRCETMGGMSPLLNWLASSPLLGWNVTDRQRLT
jgi:hypothetical protein